MNLSRAVRLRIRNLRRDGWEAEAISFATGVTLGRVRNVLRDSGMVGPREHMLASYQPPDPDDETLTPRQRAERRESRRAALLLKTEIDMTEDIARNIVHASSMDLELDLGLDASDIGAVRHIAREWWERMRAAKAEARPLKAGKGDGIGHELED